MSPTPYEEARERYERKLREKGRPCGRCGQFNFRHDPICRKCHQVVNGDVAIGIAVVVVGAMLGLLLWRVF
jgi:uncharacterized OB-fold protein